MERFRKNAGGSEVSRIQDQINRIWTQAAEVANAEMQMKAERAAENLADQEPTISVAEIASWRTRLIRHDGKLYEVTVKEVPVFCVKEISRI